MIAVHNLTKNYGNKSVLSNINLTFASGKVTSLIGPNGAGKSTLLMLMAGLLDPSSGHVSFNERHISQIATADYARMVATLRQSPEFNLKLTVEELISFGRFPYSRGALTTDDWMVIDEAIDFLAIDELRYRYLDEISGGQRQMAFLAMTIAQKTKVLLLDEPLNNLDMKHAVNSMQALRRLADEQRQTIILVIHDINFAANYSDQIVALKNGSLCFQGSTEKMITETNLAELYGLDFEIINNSRGCFCNYFTTSGQKYDRSNQ